MKRILALALALVLMLSLAACGGKGGKLLLIKDSYGNTFAQFPVEDYAEVHMLDLRFFRGDVAQYAKDNGITEVLALYGAQGFCSNAITAQS